MQSHHGSIGTLPLSANPTASLINTFSWLSPDRYAIVPSLTSAGSRFATSSGSGNAN
jgi:hypothetical protein